MQQPIKTHHSQSVSSAWWVYMIKTDCGQLYTGIATDVERRFSEHLATFQGSPKTKASKGAKYFRGHKPTAIVYRQACQNRSEASIIECKIKRMSVVDKKLLVSTYQAK